MRGINILPIACILATAATTSTPAWADSPQFDWSGPYVGIVIGNRNMQASGTGCALDPNSSVGGDRGCDKAGETSWNGIAGNVHLGYNWQTSPHLVVGIESAVYLADTDYNQDGVSKYGISYNTSQQRMSADLRGRIGYAADRLLIYGTGGAALMRIETTKTQGPCGDGKTPPNYSQANCSIPPYNAVPFGTVNESSETRIGWTLGGGAQFAVSKSISIRAEYIHADYGTYTFQYPSFNRVNTTNVNTDDFLAGVVFKF